MNKETLAKAVDEIDLELIDETIKNGKSGKGRLYIIKYASVAAVFVLTAVTVIVYFGRAPEAVPPESEDILYADSSCESESDGENGAAEHTAEKNTEKAVSEVPAQTATAQENEDENFNNASYESDILGGIDGFGTGGHNFLNEDENFNNASYESDILGGADGFGTGGHNFLTAAHTPAAVVGNGLSDKQLKQYAEKQKETVKQSLLWEYGDVTGEIRIYTKGYCHASLGKKNIVNRNYVTLPITVNGKIVAAMEVFSIYGELSCSISIGGDTWDARNRVFEENPQEDIVFVWAGGVCEAAVTKDNKIYEIVPGGRNFLDDGEDWYSLLKTDCNTFSTEDLNNPDNYISEVID